MNGLAMLSSENDFLEKLDYASISPFQILVIAFLFYFWWRFVYFETIARHRETQESRSARTIQALYIL